MNYQKQQLTRNIYVGITSLFLLISFVMVQYFLLQLRETEKTRVKSWADAVCFLLNAPENEDVSLAFKMINENVTIPVIIVDEDFKIVDYTYGIKNIKLPSKKQSIEKFIANCVEEFGKNHAPIEIMIGDKKQYIYYDDSEQLKYLKILSIALILMTIFFFSMMVIYIVKINENQHNIMMIGLCKETAHQLGTPISSLAAWLEILKLRYKEDDSIDEMDKDIERLKLVAERFSKIGSDPKLTKESLFAMLRSVIEYIKVRTSKKLEIMLVDEIHREIFVKANSSIFEWAIENIFKNAIDAMGGQGKIEVRVTVENQICRIFITDEGYGVPKLKYKAIFSPGYTTKSSGWGFGLPLTKRIIEKYHKGKVYVKSSEINKGTVFCIELNELKEMHYHVFSKKN